MNSPPNWNFLARNPDLINLVEGSHLTPIPLDKDLSSLSAILMDDDYYTFVLEQSDVVEGLHLATAESLICIEARAFLDMRSLKTKGIRISKRDIRKHKNDVVRLTALLREGISITLPKSVKTDMKTFISILQKEPPDVRAIFRTMGIPQLNLEMILSQLRKTFIL